jgi:hypothetical protein
MPVLFASGCAMVAAGVVGGAAVGMAYAQGRYERIYSANIDVTWNAVVVALGDLSLPVPAQPTAFGMGYRVLDFKAKNGDVIHIDVEEVPETLPNSQARTRVGVRVADFGDEKLSQQLLEQIEIRLRSSSTTTPHSSLPTSFMPPTHRPNETPEPPLALPAKN